MGQINLLKTDTPQTPSSGRTGIYIDSTNAPILILDDGSEIPLGGTTLEQIYIDAITGGQNPSSENPFVTLEQLNQAVSGGVNSIVYGGTVQWSRTGLVFNGSASGYIIQGVYHEIAQDTLTLTTADATDDRRDRFKLTVSGWDFDTGTPAPIPVAPSVDSITEIDRGDVLIEATSTTPTVTDEDVYLENTEWTTSSGGTGTFNANSTADPFAGTKSFEATSVQAGGYMQFTNGSDFDVSDVDSIGLQLKLKATMNNGRSLRVQFFNNSDVAVSQSVPLPIVKNNSSTYQFCGIDKATMGFTASSFRKIRITYSGTGGASTYTGYFIDNVILESGIVQTPVASGVESVSGDFVNNTDPNNPIILYQAATLRASNTVLFDKDYLTGNAGARSGNILFDFTGAQLGAVTFMKHDNSGAYTFPSEGEVRDFEIAKLALVTGDVWFAFTMIDNTASSEVVFIQLSLTEAQLIEYNS